MMPQDSAVTSRLFSTYMYYIMCIYHHCQVAEVCTSEHGSNSHIEEVLSAVGLEVNVSYFLKGIMTWVVPLERKE